MKQFFALCLTLLILLTCVVPVAAHDGQVIYEEGAEKFFFLPGSEESPTDLFPEFKDVMPGDTLEQRIVIKNDKSNRCKIKVYMRALGAHANSVDFLSQLHLRVEKSEDNTMAYMFDAAATETAQLTDWVCLGTLYSGGEVNLNVILDVPVDLDNTYQQQIGYLDWEFMIEEYEIEPSDPEPPKTGDDSLIFLWAGLMVTSLIMLILLLFLPKRKKEDA